MVQNCPLFVNVHTIENVNAGGQKSQNLVNVVCERPLILNALGILLLFCSQRPHMQVQDFHSIVCNTQHLALELFLLSWQKSKCPFANAIFFAIWCGNLFSIWIPPGNVYLSNVGDKHCRRENKCKKNSYWMAKKCHICKWIYFPISTFAMIEEISFG